MPHKTSGESSFLQGFFEKIFLSALNHKVCIVILLFLLVLPAVSRSKC
jgi:hypothetical protein